MATPNNPDTQIDPGSELVQIKRLLVLMLTKYGASQKEIAEALGVNQATVSRNYRGTAKPFRVSVISEGQR